MQKICAIPLALAITLFLCGCKDELTRAKAQEIISSARSSACQASLSFLEGGFERAKAAGVVKAIPGGWSALDGRWLVVDIPNEQDRWLAISDFDGQRIVREKNPRRCINGSATVTTIVDGPMESIKLAEYTELVQLPRELEPIRSYIYVAYSKKAGFQRTDQGWRLAR